MYYFGLIGHPVKHSFSREWMQKRFIKTGLEADYQLIDLPDIKDFELLLHKKKWHGFNVTIPYKQRIIKYLDELSDTVAEINAVNTIYISNQQKLIGYNTDVIGFRSSLLSHINSNKDYKALILGNGGASQAVQYVLHQLGMEYIIVTRENTLHPISSSVLYNAQFKSYCNLTANDIKYHNLIINTTPLGMSPNIDTFPEIPYQNITPDHVLLDLVYNPEKTKFMKKGEQYGAHVVSGLEMLHAQAEASLNIWLQRE